VTVSPAYGRDYKSKAAVVVDFNNELDFIIEDFGDSYCGKPVNRAQLVELGYRREKDQPHGWRKAELHIAATQN